MEVQTPLPKMRDGLLELCLGENGVVVSSLRLLNAPIELDFSVLPSSSPKLFFET